MLASMCMQNIKQCYLGYAITFLVMQFKIGKDISGKIAIWDLCLGTALASRVHLGE